MLTSFTSHHKKGDDTLERLYSHSLLQYIIITALIGRYIHVAFSTSHDFRHPPEVLEFTPVEKGGDNSIYSNINS